VLRAPIRGFTAAGLPKSDKAAKLAVKKLAEAKEYGISHIVALDGKNDAAKKLAQQLLERQESKKE